MNKLQKIVFATIVALGLWIPLASAATVLFPSGGGTGTSSTPTYGQILVGNSGGTYTLTATSTLGTFSQWLNNGSNIYYNLGNVGIGTTSPLYPLTVRGDTYHYGGSFFESTTTSAVPTEIFVDGNGYLTARANPSTPFNNRTIFQISSPRTTLGNEGTLTTLVNYTGGNQEGVDWYAQNYGPGADLDGINIWNTGTGTLKPFCIGYWPGLAGSSQTNTSYSYCTEPWGSSGFGIASSSVNLNAQVQISTSTAPYVLALYGGTPTNLGTPVFNVSPQGTTSANYFVSTTTSATVPNMTLGTGLNQTTYALTAAGGRAMFGYDLSRGSTVINSGSSKGIDMYVNGTNGSFLSGTNALSIASNGNVGIGSTTPTHNLSIGNYVSIDGTGLINLGYTPIEMYQDAYGSLVHLTGNPGYYFPRMLNVNYAPPDNTANNLGDQETGASYELPVNTGCYNGSSFNCAQGIEIGSQRYSKSGTNYYSNINYINAYKRTTGTTTPIAISFENKDLNTFETRYVAEYLDPSGATAFGGYASTTSNSANRYDPTIPLQVGSSTASILFAADSTARTHVFQITNAGLASTTNLTVSGLGTPAGSFLAVNGSGQVIATTSPSGSGSGTVSSGLQGQNAFYNANGTTVSGTSTMIFAQNGNIGIGGTTTPNSLVSIKGKDNSGSTYALDITNGTGAEKFHVADNGSVLTTGSMSIGGNLTFTNPSSSEVDSSGILAFQGDTFDMVSGSSANEIYLGGTTGAEGSGVIINAPTIDGFTVDMQSTGGTAQFLNGNVGIDTSSPTEKLEVNDGNIRLDSLQDDHQRYITMNNSGGDKELELESDTANGFTGLLTSQKLWLGSNGLFDGNAGGGLGNGNPDGGTFLIDTNGNVGIGTTSPWRALSVKGSSDLGINALAGSFTGTTTATSTLAGGISALRLNTTATSTLAGINVTTGLSVTGTTALTGDLSMIPNGSTNRNINFNTGFGSAALTLYDGGAGGRYGWGLKSGEMQFFVPGSNHFSFNTGGDIQNPGTNEVMRIMGSGNVGIGVTAPNESLETNGNIRIPSTNQLKWDTGGVRITGNNSTQKFSIFTNNNENLVVTTSGNVGVGTSTPYGKLITWGNGIGTGINFELNNSASTTLFRKLDNGNEFVKVGTNQAYGTTTLSGGAATVSNNLVQADSLIFVSDCNSTGLTNIGSPYVSAISAGTSFTVTSSNILDASKICYEIKNPIY